MNWLNQILQKINRPSKVHELRQRNRELEILNSITQGLSHGIELNEAMNFALEEVVKLLDLKTGWIWLWENESEKSYLGAAYNLPPVLKDNPHWMSGTCYCLDTYQKGNLNKAANINEITCSRLKNETSGTEGLKYHASVPLYAYGRKMGLLNVASTDWQKLSGDKLRLLYTIGDILSIAIERARLFENSRRMGMMDERNRISREIHDTLAQGLSAISLKLEATEALLESGNAKTKVDKLVNQALHLARYNLKEARNSVLDLRATPLESENLKDALSLLIKESRGAGSPKIKLEIIDAYQPLSIKIEIGLYRIAKEALTNAINHSEAKTITVQLIYEEEKIILIIKDDGKGFDLTTIPDNRFGLISMRERAKLLNGKLEIESNSQFGTEIKAIIPKEQ